MIKEIRQIKTGAIGHFHTENGQYLSLLGHGWCNLVHLCMNCLNMNEDIVHIK